MIPPPGAKTFKQWKIETAEGLGTTLHNVEVMLSRGRLEPPQLVKLNKRVAYVKP